MEKIDFVISWVDGNDKEWQKEREKYIVENNNDNSDVRYRNWDNLKYWFRGVEKFAPFVNKIYFITYGHLPEWLNVNNPKLVIVNHKDYIPEKYLPTFNSHTIELNLHRIKGLSENFVYFNDDMFLNDYVKEKDFFKNGLPVDSAIFSPYIPKKYDDMNILCWNMIGIINKNFSKKQFVKENFFKVYNFKYGRKLIRTILISPWPNFTGFYESHLPNSYCKSVLEEVWKKEYEILDMTSKDKFRNIKTHVNQWLFRYWQLASGKFTPRKANIGQYFDLSNKFDKSKQSIEKQKYKMICLNDTEQVEDFEIKKQILKEIFERKLPQKSTYEK